MDINKSDVIWNYGATFMRVASMVLVFPLIIKMLSADDVGLWTGVMINLTSMITMLDFGFYTTFSRNVTYIFAGAKSIKEEGVAVNNGDTTINYPLLKGLLKSMKIYYGSVSLILIIIFATAGVWYIGELMEGYSGDVGRAKLAWFLYCGLISYQFYTFYYDAILVGRGRVKKSKQIIVLSQSIHMVIASILLLAGMGILSMVISQTIATIVNKTLSKRAFYDRELKENLSNADYEPWRPIMKKLWKITSKSGFSSLSWTLTNKLLPIVAALYLTLEMMGSYGMSKVVVDFAYTLSLVWFLTYYPKLTRETVSESKSEIKRIVVKAQVISVVTFFICAIGALIFGDWSLTLLKKGATFIHTPVFALFFMAAMFDSLTYISTSTILGTNRAPFYKAQIITAAVTIVALLFSLEYISPSVATLIMVPFATQLIYNHWKWFMMVAGELKIGLSDYGKAFINLIELVLSLVRKRIGS